MCGYIDMKIKEEEEKKREEENKFFSSIAKDEIKKIFDAQNKIMEMRNEKAA